MPRSRIPSPARSQGVISTPRRHKSRGSRSVCSPTPSTGSGRLTSIIDQFKEKNFDSFALSPVNARRSVLTDNTDIEEPRRKSWWKNLNENSRDVMEALVDNKATEPVNAIEDIVDVEILSQEKKNYTLDLPESSDNESINSIVIPQRKLFSLKENQPQKKFGQLVGARETLAKLHKTHNDKTITAGTKDLFQATKRSKPVFPAALLNISPNKTTADKTKENAAAESKAPVRNIFGSRPANKRKNIFADFIVSESEDEISDIQPKVFGFQNKGDQQKISSLGKGRDNSPTSSITTDIEMDEWKHLPSSTMVEHQLDEMVAGTPVKRARLSKLSEVKESEAGTYYTTVDKSRQNITSPKDVSIKIAIKDKTINEKDNINDDDENNMILVYEGDEELLEEKNVDNAQNKNSSRVQNNVTIIDKTKTKIVDKTNVLDNEHNDSKHMHKTKLNKSVSKFNANESKINKSQKSILANKTNHLEKTEEHGPQEEKVEDLIDTETKNKNAVNLSIQIQEDHSILNKELEKNEIPPTEEDQEIEVKESGDDEMADIEQGDNKIIESEENEKELNKSSSVKTHETKADSNQNMETDSNQNMETDKTQTVRDDATEKKITDNENENINEAEGNKTAVDAFASKINKSNRSKLADKTKNLEEPNKHDHVEERVEDIIQTETNNSQITVSRQVKETPDNKEQKVSGVQTEKSQDMEAEKYEDEEMTEINEGPDKEDDNDDRREEENESHLDESLEGEADSSKKMETDKSKSVREDENEKEESGNNEDEESDNNEDEESDNNEEDEFDNNEQDESDNNEQDESDNNEQDESDNNEEDDEENVTLQINEGKEQEINQSQDEVDQSEEIENYESEDDEVEKSQDIEAEQSGDEKMTEIDEKHNKDSESEEEDNHDEREVRNESHLDESLEGEADSSKRMETDKGESVQEDENEEEESDNNEEDAEENLSVQEDHDVNESQEQENNQYEVDQSKESGNRPSLAPPRDSLGLSEGTKDSSAEGSGWDSHRTTRKTLRQTFGKDFTPRKSLRALVMEKAAKHTAHIETLNNDTVKFPQANSTEYPEVSNREENVTMESDHELSRRTRQTTLETYLQKIKQQNMEKRMKMEEAIRNSLKAPPPRDPLSLFKMPLKPVRKTKTVTNKPKKTIPNIFQGELPPEVVEDMKYKPPKRFQPSQASWITKRLYKYLERKLEPKYDYKARVRAEKLVETIFYFVKELRRHKVASPDAVEVLKHEMARLDIVKTHFEFYEFFHEFMPREVIVKVNPDIVNNIALPRHGVFSDIIRGNNG